VCNPEPDSSVSKAHNLKTGNPLTKIQNATNECRQDDQLITYNKGVGRSRGITVNAQKAGFEHEGRKQNHLARLGIFCTWLLSGSWGVFCLFHPLHSDFNFATLFPSDTLSGSSSESGQDIRTILAF
jgi:hypothetical protein